MHVGVRELRRDLAALVRRAERGESVVVTVSGRAVAVLGPIDPGGAAGPSADPRALLDDLVAHGAVQAPRHVRPRSAGADHPSGPPERERLPVDARSAVELRTVR